jgi:amidase
MGGLAFASLVDLARDLRMGRVSSRDLLEIYAGRIEHHNSAINAVVSLDLDRARARADAADAARARGDDWGPLHGVPMTLKDTYEVAGLRTTAGAPEYTDHVPAQHSEVARRLLDAGAVIFGKTNVPYLAGDLQTFNQIFGTTNNPWDLTRTPGGSSGGAAAAVAAGLTSCEVGSDIGGSIRVPSSFCGVFGHKPSWGVVSSRGHIPGPPGTLAEPDINVCGPIGRSVGDLALLMDVLVGPTADRAAAWQCRLPPARRVELRQYRVAAWVGETGRPLDDEVTGLLDRAIGTLRRAGVAVDPRARPAVPFLSAVEVFWKLLIPIVSDGMPAEQLEMLRTIAAGPTADDLDPLVFFARCATQSHQDWLRTNEQRERMCVRWAEFFHNFDVLLCPVTPVPAFPHTQDGEVLTRTVRVNDRDEPYMELLSWMGLIGVARLPSTVIPVGTTKSGLPVGVQIVGPYLEDRTTIDFAGRLAAILDPIGHPPGYGSQAS